MHAVAALQTLGQAGQQVAHGAVGVAFLLQTLPFQAVFAEAADGLRHVPNLVHMGAVGRDRIPILRGQTGDDVAQADDRTQDALFQDEIEDAQEEQGGDAQHDFRHGAPLTGGVGCARHGMVGTLIQHILEFADLRGDAVQFAAIFVAEQDGAAGLVVARLSGADRGVLLVRQRVRPMQRLTQCGKFAFIGAGIAQMGDALLDRLQRALLTTVGDQMARIAADDEAARLFGKAIDILLQRGGGLVEGGALGDGGAFAFFGARCHQHGGARRQSQGDGGSIGPVGDGRQTHDASDGSRDRLAIR